MQSNKCEIIGVGDEILAGHCGKSSFHAARILSGEGIDINRITHTGDKKREIKQVLKEITSRSSFIVIIGGTGSTADDNTVIALSEFLNKKLQFSRKAMENVAAYFSRRGLEVPRHCDSQAEILEDARVLKNKKGSVPGQLLKTEKNIFLILPGPLKEVDYILKNRMDSSILKKYGRNIRKEAVLRTTGICEGEISEFLKDIIETERHLEEEEVGFCFKQSPAGVDIIISCIGDNEILVDELLHKTKNEIYGEIEFHIYGEDKDTLEEKVRDLLTKNRKTISVAESCTGGLLSSKITDAPGSSVYFETGMVTYSNRAKKEILKIDEKLISKDGPVSKEVAKEMVEKIMNKTGADVSLSVTGFAGPEGLKTDRPGTGYIGLKIFNDTTIKKVEFNGNRKEVKTKFAYRALDMVRQYFEKKKK